MSYMEKFEAAVLALTEFAAETGQRLPESPQDIALLEQGGHIVDLETGEVIWHGANARHAATLAGQAVAND